MDLQHVLRTIRDQWYLVVGSVVVALLLATGWILLQTPMFKASAEVFVSSSGTAGNSQAGEQFQAAVFAQQRVATYAQLVSSPEVLEPVIEELALTTTPQDLAGVVTAVNPSQTVLIEVSATDAAPDQAAAIANLAARNLAAAIQNLETTNPKAGSPIKVSVVNPAVAPPAPYAPNKLTTLGLALLLGLAAGIGAALLRDQLDTSVKGSSDLLSLSGATPLGVIGFDPNAETTPLSALDQQAPRSESFRQIRTNLQYVDVDNPPKILAVTSSMAGEGKSTAACNLAISMAQSGLRVCIVEADLRRPKVGVYLGVESSVGLTDVLAGKIPLQEALVPWSRNLLTLLPSGSIPPNPSELLASDHMKETLNELRADFDAVILDTAPLLMVSDASITAAVADGAILIVRHSKTTSDQVSKSLDSLDRVGARLLGTVLNFAPTKRRGYGYGYGYGYGSDASRPGTHVKPIRRPAMWKSKGRTSSGSSAFSWLGR